MWDLGEKQMNLNMQMSSFDKNSKKRKKRLFQISIVLLAMLGVVYQQLGIYYDASHLGRMGRLVDVNGVNMHLYEAGNSDIPIVFAANIGSNVPYVETYLLHSNLSSKYHTLVYDKPGYGWSDITSAPRDIDTICDEIHTLVHSDEIPDDEDTYLKPFVFVAYGMGSLEALRYAQLYPEDIAGVVLIEGASPQFCKEFNNIMIVEAYITNGLRNLGLLRAMGETSVVNNTLNSHTSYPKNLQLLTKGIGLEKTWNRNMIAEKHNVQKNGEAVLSGGDLGDIPLRIITSKANTYSTWSATQKSMLSLSTDSKQIYIEHSTSYIEASDAPTILQVIEELTQHIQELKDDE